jgi:hypothetical protein
LGAQGSGDAQRGRQDEQGTMAHGSLLAQQGT